MSKKQEAEKLKKSFGELCEWELNFLLAKSLGYRLRLKNDYSFLVVVPEEGDQVILKRKPKLNGNEPLFHPTSDWFLIGKVVKEICPNCHSMTDGTYIVSKGLLSIHGKTFQEAVLKLYLLFKYGYEVEKKEFVLMQRATLQRAQSVKVARVQLKRSETR